MTDPALFIWSNMQFIGLDPSIASFGYSVINYVPEKDQASIVESSTIKTAPTTYMLERFKILQEGLRGFLRGKHLAVVGLESPVFGGTSSPMLYALYIQTLMILKEFYPVVVCIGPKQLKHLVGVSSPKKSAMVNAAKEKFNVKRLPSDEADATWLAYFAARFYLGVLTNNCKLYLSDREKKIFLSEELNSAKLKKGIIYRPNEFYYNFRADVEVMNAEMGKEETS